MKLSEAIKEHGHPFLVPDCSRNELPSFFKELGFKVGLEVGVWEADFTKRFCEEGLKMYGVDPWEARQNHPQWMEDARYEKAKEKVKDYDCTIIRKTSMEAVKDFEDESLDFVYIDGMHKYAFVYEDIVEWTKKVKKGGVIAGHDYICTDPCTNQVPVKYQLHLQVQAAVDRYIEENGIEDFYIFGRTKPLEEEVKNDTMLSWLFFKKN